MISIDPSSPWGSSISPILQEMRLRRSHGQEIGNCQSEGSEKAMAPHSSALAWKILWTEEPGRLQSTGSWRVGHNWAISLSFFTFMHCRRKWQPIPVFLPGESQGRGSLMVRESFPRQVDKESRVPQGERGLEFSRRKKGQTFFSSTFLRII